MDDRDTSLTYLANMQRRRTPAEQEPEPQEPARASSLDLFRAGLRTGYDAPGLSEATESAIALPAPERARLQRQRGTQASSSDLFRAGMRTGMDAPGLSRETQRAVASRTPAPLPTPEPPTPAPEQGAAESASVLLLISDPGVIDSWLMMSAISKSCSERVASSFGDCVWP